MRLHRGRAVCIFVALALVGIVAPRTDPVAHAAVVNAWSALTGSESTYHKINAIAVNGSDVYIAGEFTNLNGDAGRDYIAKWNGSTWSNVGGNSALNNNVHALAIIGTTLFVGGEFTNAGGEDLADGIAAVDLGTGTWSAVGSNGASAPLPAAKHAMAFLVDSSTTPTSLVAGGTFGSAGGVLGTRYVARWTPGSPGAWSALGTADFEFEGTVGGVAALARIGTDYYAGAFGGTPTASLLMKTSGGAWSAVSWGDSMTNARSSTGGTYSGVYALYADSATLYVGGNFKKAGGNLNYLAKLDTSSSTWSSVGSGSSCTAYNYSERCIRTITKTASSVYVGGDIGLQRVKSSDNSGYSVTNEQIFALGVDASNLIVAGSFTDRGGIAAADYIAKFTPSTTSTLDILSTTAGSLDTTFSSGTSTYSVNTEASTATITAAASNNGSFVEYSIDGGLSYTALPASGTTLSLDPSLGVNTWKVRVEPSDGSGTRSVYTLSVTRTHPPLVNVAPPTVSGAAEEGQSLTGANGTWTGMASFSRTWYRCTSVGASAVNAVPGTCTLISAQTSTSYSLVAGDVGRFIRYSITATGVDSTTQQILSASTSAIAILPASTSTEATTSSVSATSSTSTTTTAQQTSPSPSENVTTTVSAAATSAPTTAATQSASSTATSPAANTKALSAPANTSTKTGAALLVRVAIGASTKSVTASGLPAGVRLNKSTGVISGKPTKKGVYSVTIAAIASGKRVTLKFKITVK